MVAKDPIKFNDYSNVLPLNKGMDATPAWNLSLASLAKTWVFGPGIFVVLLVGALLLMAFKPRRSDILFVYLVAVTGVFYLYFSRNPGHWLGDPLLSEAHRLEVEATPADCAQRVPTIVVLGGGLALPGEPSAATILRLNEAARLLSQLSEQKQARNVIVSGGSTWPGSTSSEAAAGIGYLRARLGAAAQLHTFYEENRSLNTMQNAAFTHALAVEHHLPVDIVLITGGYHLPRAVAAFRHNEFTVCPHASPETPMLHLLSFDNAVRTYMVLNEWIGRVVYELLGWS